MSKAKPAPKPATRATAKPAAKAAAKPATRTAAKPSSTASAARTTPARAGATRTTPTRAGATRATPTRAGAARTTPAKPRLRASHEGYTRSAEDAPARVATKRAASASRGSAVAPRTSSRASTRPPARASRPPAAPAPKAAPKGIAAPRKPRGKAAPIETPLEASTEARELALAIASAGIDKKALGIEILDVTGKVDYADFLVVMTGRSDRHVHSIAVGIEEDLRRKKRAPLSVEGLSVATWVLIDFGDVVVHVFQEDARSLYDIEGLWVDASRVPVEGSSELEA